MIFAVKTFLDMRCSKWEQEHKEHDYFRGRNTLHTPKKGTHICTSGQKFGVSKHKACVKAGFSLSGKVGNGSWILRTRKLHSLLD